MDILILKVNFQKKKLINKREHKTWHYVTGQYLLNLLKWLKF